MSMHERSRGQLFDSAFHDRFGQWPVGYIPAGGADMGDIVAVADAVGGGDDSAFYDAFVASGDAMAAEARALRAAGRRRSARDRFLRASCMYGAAYHPIYGTPVDPRLLAAFDAQMEAFGAAMELSDAPVRPVEIPFADGPLPAYLVPATGRETEVRPLLILTNGFDATITDMYFASGVAALDRGYHVLMFDGPGQGAMLYRKGVPLRPDWETIVAAVVDYAQTVPIVDTDRIALSGWSLGGYLAPRAASGEPRLAACIADPGQWDVADAIRRFLAVLGVPDAATVSGADLDEATVARLMAAIEADRELHWQIVQRGFWATGTADLRGLFDALTGFTLKVRVGDIRCPTLCTAAENDPLTADTQAFYDALACPKELLRFTAAEGAGAHTEAINRSLANQRVLDWLDAALPDG